MWCVKEVPDLDAVEAMITLDVSQFGRGLSKGFDGQQKKGFSFFELKESQRGRLR